MKISYAFRIFHESELRLLMIQSCVSLKISHISQVMMTVMRAIVKTSTINAKIVIDVKQDEKQCECYDDYVEIVGEFVWFLAFLA